MEENKTRVRLRTAVTALALIVAGLVIVGSILVYATDLDNPPFRFFKRLIPFPAAIIDYRTAITVGELENNVAAVKRFYENQDFSQVGLRTDFSTEDGRKRLIVKERGVFNKMIEDAVIEILARKKGIIITEAMVDDNVSRKLQEFGSEKEVQENLAAQYGWSIGDFKEKIVRPGMYQEELEKYYRGQNESRPAAEEKIKQAQARMEEGQSFGMVAREFSEGATAGTDGELGWFKSDQLVPAVAQAIVGLEKGQRTGIVESELGFHIVEVEDRSTDENGEELIRVRQIFTRVTTFGQWLEKEMRAMSFIIPIRKYRWSEGSQTVEFRSSKLQSLEQEVIEQSQGDASLLFLF